MTECYKHVNRYSNGDVYQEMWFKKDSKGNCQLHREDDLPAKIEYLDDGRIKQQMWYQNGVLFRENQKPTIVDFFQFCGGGYGTVTETWTQNGKISRTDKEPAVIWYTQNNTIWRKEWMQNQQHFRQDFENPCTIIYAVNDPNVVAFEYWYRNNRLHRDGDLPARVQHCPHQWWSNRTINNDAQQSREWFYYGVLHRFGFVWKHPNSYEFDLKPSVIIDNTNFKYHIYGCHISANKYYLYLYLFRRCIRRFKRRYKSNLYQRLKSHFDFNIVLLSKVIDFLCSKN